MKITSFFYLILTSSVPFFCAANSSHSIIINQQDTSRLQIILNKTFDHENAEEILLKDEKGNFKPVVFKGADFFEENFSFPLFGKSIENFAGDISAISEKDNNVIEITSFEQSAKKVKLTFNSREKRFKVNLRNGEEGWRVTKISRKGKKDRYIYVSM